MLPTFRNDLVCSREEQQGVVFYRIDDPKTQTSFRLYEIEYLIAQKLDGTQSLQGIIDAVKNEFNFDISAPDLERFIGQLESMGFISNSDGPKPAMATDHEGETKVMDRPKPPEELDIVEPDMVVDEGEPSKKAEFERLLKSALLHVKQGYIVHARDYFLAAREINPTDERLGNLIRHLEIIGDASGPAEVTYLWTQAKELFPEQVEAVGPLADTASSRPSAPRMTDPSVEGKEESVKSRVAWTVILLSVLGVGLGALYYIVKVAKIFDNTAQVAVAPIQASRVPVYFPLTATEVKPISETVLAFQSAGTVGSAIPAVGTHVEAGAILAQLKLPLPMEKQLEKAKEAVAKEKAKFDQAAKALESLTSERDRIETERTTAENSLRDLRPKSVLGQGGVSKRDIEEFKRTKVQANKKLTLMAKKEKKPRAAATKAEKSLAAAKAKLDALEKKLAPRLVRAPFAGTVVEVKVAAGQDVTENQPVLVLRDTSGVRLTFTVPEKTDLQIGGEVQVAVGRGTPTRAKIGTLVPAGAEKKVEISMSDATGEFSSMAAKEFRMVKEFVEPAFIIPNSAVIEDQRGTRVLLALQNRALERPVEVIERDEANAVVRDNSGALKEKALVVVARIGGGEISSIQDGSILEIQGAQ